MSLLAWIDRRLSLMLGTYGPSDQELLQHQLDRVHYWAPIEDARHREVIRWENENVEARKRRAAQAVIPLRGREAVPLRKVR